VDGSRTSTRARSAVPVPDGRAGTAEVVDALADAINRHDLDALVDCFDADVESLQPVHPDRAFAGRERIRLNWGLILEGVPDLSARAVATTVGDDEAWVEWEWTGGRRDGQPFHMRGVTILTVRDGRIAAVRLYMEPVHDAGAGVARAVREAVGS
jgi:ketosteroid isomerase-like protein